MTLMLRIKLLIKGKLLAQINDCARELDDYLINNPNNDNINNIIVTMDLYQKYCNQNNTLFNRLEGINTDKLEHLRRQINNQCNQNGQIGRCLNYEMERNLRSFLDIMYPILRLNYKDNITELLRYYLSLKNINPGNRDAIVNFVLNLIDYIENALYGNEDRYEYIRRLIEHFYLREYIRNYNRELYDRVYGNENREAGENEGFPQPV